MEVVGKIHDLVINKSNLVKKNNPKMDDMRDISQNQLGGGKLERRLISSLGNIKEGVNNFLLMP